jgi:hypothetical protein
MSYTILPKNAFALSKMIRITDNIIYFTTAFRQKFKTTRYMTFYANDENFLCFRFSDTPTEFSYKVTLNSGNAYFVRFPAFLKEIVPIGVYDAVENDGYIVTDCKLKSK